MKRLVLLKGLNLFIFVKILFCLFCSIFIMEINYLYFFLLLGFGIRNEGVGFLNKDFLNKCFE